MTTRQDQVDTNRMNRKLLLEAAEMSGLSERQFAMQKLGINERTFRRWKEGGAIPEGKMNLIRSRHRESIRIQIRRAKQGVSPETQRWLLQRAQERRERRANKKH